MSSANLLPAASLPQDDEQLFNRPPRIHRALPHDEIVVPAPPAEVSAGGGPQLSMALLPLLTALMYVGIMVARGAGTSRAAAAPIIGGSLLSGGLGLYGYLRRRRDTRRARQAHAATYAELLQETRARLQQLDQLQRAIREANDPAIAQLSRIVHGTGHQPASRLWERRPADADFLALRIGLGTLPTTLTIKPPQAQHLLFSPALQEARAIAAEFRAVADVPLTLALRNMGAIGIAGPSDAAREQVTALLWQIAVHHSPSEVRVLALWSCRDDSSWEWLRWLPHTAPLDGDDTYRLLAQLDGPAAPLRQVLSVLQQELQRRQAQPGSDQGRPHLVVIVDSYGRAASSEPALALALRSGAALGCTMVCMVDQARDVPGECGAYIDRAAGPTLSIAGAGGGRHAFTPDRVSLAASSALARGLAPIVQTESAGQRTLPRSVRLLPLLGIADARAFDPWQRWRQIPSDSWHPIPCGLRDTGAPLLLNLNEGFDGVHGMLAGTTGSGKSEFLLTFLIALALTHSPDRVNFMLIDFKGGATFQGLATLPHTAGIVTDLQGNLAERALIAINGELDRRKQRLAAAAQRSASGDVPNIRAYRTHGFEHEPGFGPMPNLLIAIDEFDEMVRDYPEFVAELVRVAKQGRSLGVHLLFATQQPSAIKEGLTRNLTYWIALRVTGADDSKMMVGIPDAAYLTTETPGRGYLRVGKEVTAFQSARITVPYQPPRAGSTLGTVDITGRWQPLTATDAAALSPSQEATGEHDLSLIARAMGNDPATGAGYAARRYPIWTEPLGSEIHWGALPETQATPSGWLSAPLGLLDLPAEARQHSWVLQLAEQHGNVLILGAARSGKTTAVRTLLLALAQRHTPAELWLYLIDPGGFGCGFVAPLETTGGTQLRPLLPHVADAFGPAQSAKVERLLIELQEHIRQRQALLQRHGADSLAQLYARPAERRPDDLPPAIVVVVENIAELAAAQPEALDALKSLLRDTRRCGIYCVATGYTWRDIAPLQSSFETRIALRLNDPADSDAAIGKPYAARISAEQPGRAFLRTAERPLELQIALPALPRTCGPSVPPDFQASLRHLAERFPARTAGWPLPLRELPRRITRAALAIPATTPASFGTPIALDGLTLEPVQLDLAITPHVLIAGGPRSGKTELLRTILSGLAARYTGEAVRFALVDYRRRGLRPFATGEHALRVDVPGQPPHVASRQVTLVTCEAEVRALVGQLATELARRAATDEHGPRIVLAISNWDLLQDTAMLWKPLGQWVLQGRELGFHMIVTGAEYGGFVSADMLKLARLERCAAFLGAPAENSSAASTIGIRLPRNVAQLDLPPGRGFLMLGGQPRLVQFALGAD